MEKMEAAEEHFGCISQCWGWKGLCRPDKW